MASNGTVPPIQWIPCRNWSPGRGGLSAQAVVIHIAQETLASVDEFFNDPVGGDDGPVSAHYCVGRAGPIHQYVDEHDTAWHAGVIDRPTWRLIKAPEFSPNHYTIGIEHEGDTGQPWTEAMYASTAYLVGRAATTWGIPLDRLHVIGHCEIRLAKAFCPGTGVILERLVQMARDVAASGHLFSVVATAGSVIAGPGTPIRRGAPTTAAPVVQLLDAYMELVVSGVANGEALGGDGRWYCLEDGNFVWGGRTSHLNVETIE